MVQRKRFILIYLIELCIILSAIPTLVVGAHPIVATDVNVDLSWLKELPPLMITLIIAFLTLVFVTRYLQNQNKVAVQGADGEQKHVHMSEFVGITLQQVLAFMQDTKSQDRVFFTSITESLTNSNGAVVSALDALKQALVESNGNQMTALFEMRESFQAGVQQMHSSRAELTSGLSEIKTRVGSVQAEAVRMNKGLEGLLMDFRNLVSSMQTIFDRLAKIEKATSDNTQATLELKTHVADLKELVAHSTALMDALTIAIQEYQAEAARNALPPNLPTDRVPEPPAPIQEEKPNDSPVPDLSNPTV